MKKQNDVEKWDFFYCFFNLLPYTIGWKDTRVRKVVASNSREAIISKKQNFKISNVFSLITDGRIE